ncbi:MAG: hypothetical protein ACI4A7_06135 [Prevotella sp.]
MGQEQKKYHITDNGDIYRVNNDGSFTSMGNAEENINNTFKNKEYDESIKESVTTNDLAEYEMAILRGEKLNAKIRRRVAKETCNEVVLGICVMDSAKTVVKAAMENKKITSEMKSQIIKRKPREQHNKMITTDKDNSGDKGCLWFIIIICALGALFSYLKGEMWF